MSQEQQSPGRKTPHEHLLAIGLKPVGPASEHFVSIHQLMSETPLFVGLDLEEVATLSEFMHVYECAAGITMIQEGERGEFMMLLMNGSVEVLRRNSDNHPMRLAVVNAGQALGEMSMFDSEPRFASCMALESCRVAVLPGDAIETVIAEWPVLGNKIMRKLVQVLSTRLRQTSEQFVESL